MLRRDAARLMRKIGIYSGVFDPVHDGHIAFAEAAITQHKVESVYFMLEVNPRRKHSVTKTKHRLAMLELALRGKENLFVLSSNESQLSVADTLPFLTTRFPNAQLCLMMGSDLYNFVETWADYPLLRSTVSFGVAVRSGDTISETTLSDGDWVIASPLPSVSSSRIRSNASKDVPTEVGKYIESHRLYAN